MLQNQKWACLDRINFNGVWCQILSVNCLKLQLYGLLFYFRWLWKTSRELIKTVFLVYGSLRLNDAPSLWREYPQWNFQLRYSYRCEGCHGIIWCAILSAWMRGFRHLIDPMICISIIMYMEIYTVYNLVQFSMAYFWGVDLPFVMCPLPGTPSGFRYSSSADTVS